MEEKKGRKKTSSPWTRFEPTTLTMEGKAPVGIATITLHKDLWLQLLYKYHEGNNLNSIAQYPMHMKERERKCHRAEGGIPCATILLGIVLLMIFITFLLHMWLIHDHKM